MKIVLDRSRCEGHGMCEASAPHLVHLDDDGEVIIDQEDIGDDLVGAATAAVRACPVAALRLE